MRVIEGPRPWDRSGSSDQWRESQGVRGIARLDGSPVLLLQGVAGRGGGTVRVLPADFAAQGVKPWQLELTVRTSVDGAEVVRVLAFSRLGIALGVPAGAVHVEARALPGVATQDWALCATLGPGQPVREWQARTIALPPNMATDVVAPPFARRVEVLPVSGDSIQVSGGWSMNPGVGVPIPVRIAATPVLSIAAGAAGSIASVAWEVVS